MPTQTELRHAKLNRRAAANVKAFWDRLVDFYGRPLAYVKDLNPGCPGYPRLSEFRFVNQEGAWRNYGDGAEGDSVLALIEHLAGGCSRAVAAQYLESIIGKYLPEEKSTNGDRNIHDQRHNPGHGG